MHPQPEKQKTEVNEYVTTNKKKGNINTWHCHFNLLNNTNKVSLQIITEHDAAFGWLLVRGVYVICSKSTKLKLIYWAQFETSIFDNPTNV